MFASSLHGILAAAQMKARREVDWMRRGSVRAAARPPPLGHGQGRGQPGAAGGGRAGHRSTVYSLQERVVPGGSVEPQQERSPASQLGFTKLEAFGSLGWGSADGAMLADGAAISRC